MRKVSRLRSVLVHATIALPILGSLVALALDVQAWPFPHYPMYSGLHGPEAAITRAVGVTADGREVPIPRVVEPEGFHLHLLFGTGRWRPDAATKSRIATAIGAEYERLRADGEVDGPPLAEVRLYRDDIDLATAGHPRRTTLAAAGPVP